MHPTVIIQAFRQALEDMVAILGDEVGVPVNMDDEAQLIKVRLSIATRSRIHDQSTLQGWDKVWTLGCVNPAS